MLRDCQKKVIHLKDTKSKMFDEAYFIVREQATTKENVPLRSMVKEANRILAENEMRGRHPLRAKRWFWGMMILSFFSGILFWWLCYALFFM